MNLDTILADIAPGRARRLAARRALVAGKPNFAAGPHSLDDNGLTELQSQILHYIYAHARERGYQPSYREMCEVFGIGSPNAMRGVVVALIRKGWISLSGHESRAVRFLRRPHDGGEFRGFIDKE